MYGDAWDSRTLAVAYDRANSLGLRLEGDVIFNNTLSWNSYRGSLLPSPSGGTPYDFRRVALHEFGHVLGLGHPDDIGQSVPAVMNSMTSNVDSLATDDINGARAIYDSGAPIPAAKTLYFSGSMSWEFSGSQLTLRVTSVQNDRPTTTGTLQLELWALASRYDNGVPLSSRRMGVYRFPSVLSPGVGFPNVSVTVPYEPLPSGTYFVVLLLTEFTGGSGSGFTIRDAIESSNPLVIAGAVAPAITAHPVNQTVSIGQSTGFSVTATGTAPLSYQWFRNSIAINGATTATLSLANPQVSDAGAYTVRVSNSAGNVTSNPATLTVNAVIAPTITAHPGSQTVNAGASVVLTVTPAGTAPFTYVWTKNNIPIAGATAATLSLTNVQPSDAGAYAVRVSNSAGAATSNAATLTVSFSRLINLSVRSLAGTGAQTLIVGFNISGSGTKQMLLRGIGPTLGSFGVGGVLADPQLRLFNSANVQVNFNDDWGSGGPALAAAFRNAGAFDLPLGSRDAALVVPLAAGSYSAQVTATAGTGVALVEGYDADANTLSSRLSNLSVRSVTGTGADVLTVGFVIAGNANKTVLLRGIGPALAAFGVTGTVADAQIEVFNASRAVIAQNDNWAPTLAGTFASVGAFALPAASRDAALVITLPPGSYTAQVSGVGNTMGVALVEAYELP